MKRMHFKTTFIFFILALLFSLTACRIEYKLGCEHDFIWISAPPARCGYGEANAAWQICIKCDAEGESWVGPVLVHEWEFVDEIETCKHCGETKEMFFSESISQFNEYFNGEYKLAELMPSESDIYTSNIPGFWFEMGFGCYSLNSDDNFTSYGIGGFPDCLDEYAVTSFFTSDPKYNIYGFSVGASPEKANNILIQYGYKLFNEDYAIDFAIYNLGKIKIVIIWDNDDGIGGILSIHVILDVTNLEGVFF